MLKSSLLASSCGNDLFFYRTSAWEGSRRQWASPGSCRSLNRPIFPKLPPASCGSRSWRKLWEWLGLRPICPFLLSQEDAAFLVGEPGLLPGGQEQLWADPDTTLPATSSALRSVGPNPSVTGTMKSLSSLLCSETLSRPLSQGCFWWHPGDGSTTPR